MAVRNSMEENIVVEGRRDYWIQRANEALNTNGFSNVLYNTTLYQITADYKKFTIWGEILITFKPFGKDEAQTEITIKSTANVDNFQALFVSPNKTIIGKFKSGLY